MLIVAGPSRTSTDTFSVRFVVETSSRSLATVGILAAFWNSELCAAFSTRVKIFLPVFERADLKFSVVYTETISNLKVLQ